MRNTRHLVCARHCSNRCFVSISPHSILIKSKATTTADIIPIHTRGCWGTERVPGRGRAGFWTKDSFRTWVTDTLHRCVCVYLRMRMDARVMGERGISDSPVTPHSPQAKLKLLSPASKGLHSTAQTVFPTRAVLRSDQTTPRQAWREPLTPKPPALHLWSPLGSPPQHYCRRPPTPDFGITFPFMGGSRTAVGGEKWPPVFVENADYKSQPTESWFCRSNGGPRTCTL